MRKRRVGAILIGIGIILSAAGMAFPVNVLTVRLPRRDAKPIIVIRVSRESEISLNYRHSVELTEVEGHFSIGAGPVLLLKETRYTSVGSGLPNTRVDRTRRRAGWFVVDEELRISDGIRFFISPINQARLHINGRIVPLFRLEPGTLIAVNVERMTGLKWFLLRHDKLDEGR